MSKIENDKGNFLTVLALKLSYPVGKSGWYSTVGEIIYVWDSTAQDWVSKGGSIDWGTILGTITNQSDLITYIASQISAIRVGYPKDYVALIETLEIRQYENYAVYNPMVNDGVISNYGTLIIN